MFSLCGDLGFVRQPPYFCRDIHSNKNLKKRNMEKEREMNDRRAREREDVEKRKRASVGIKIGRRVVQRTNIKKELSSSVAKV